MEKRDTPTSPGVTVVIPAFNYGRFLPDAIDSALAQSYPNVEVLVVDDGSTDDTAQIAARYAGRVRYIRQENQGLSAARNTGIRHASHDHIALLDADDVLEPGMVAALMERFSLLAPDYFLVAAASRRMDAGGRLLPRRRHVSRAERDFTARDLLIRNRFMPSAVLVKRAAFETCGPFDTTLRSSEDRDMWIRIAERHRIRFIAEPLARIRKHPDNMSKNADRMRASIRRVIAKAWRRGVAPAWDLHLWLRVWAMYFYQSAWMLSDAGRGASAILHAVASILTWPFFSRPQDHGEPLFFRARSLARFLVRHAGRNSSTPPRPDRDAAVISAPGSSH